MHNDNLIEVGMQEFGDFYTATADLNALDNYEKHLMSFSKIESLDTTPKESIYWNQDGSFKKDYVYEEEDFQYAVAEMTRLTNQAKAAAKAATRSSVEFWYKYHLDRFSAKRKLAYIQFQAIIAMKEHNRKKGAINNGIAHEGTNDQLHQAGHQEKATEYLN